MAAGLSAAALQPLLEQAVRESLRELARCAVEPEVGRPSQTIGSIVQTVSARILENAGHDLEESEPGSPMAQTHGLTTPQPPPKQLLEDLVATPWVIWREASAPGRERHGVPHGPSSSSLLSWPVEDEAAPEEARGRRLAPVTHGWVGAAGAAAGAAGAAEQAMSEERHDQHRRRAVSEHKHQLDEDEEPTGRSVASAAAHAAHFCGSFPNLSLGSKPLVVKGGLRVESHDAHHLVMQWHGRPRSVLLVCKPGDCIVAATLEDMAGWLASQSIVVVLEPKLLADQPQLRGLHGVRTFSAADALEHSIDFVITIGGDGTLTWAVSLFRGPMPPTLSFAAGSLGFLTPFPLDGWVRTLTRLLDLHHSRPPLPLVCRMRLQVAVHRRRSVDGSQAVLDQRVIRAQCLNEVLVHRGQSGTLAKLDVGVDGERVTLVQGDGLILATPTGSTAYSLAAGGSMVHPAVPAILLTPVSPHSLSFRPALLPNSAVVTVGVPLTARAGAALSVDGKDICKLRIGDYVEVAMSPFPVPTICRTTETGDWFASVHEALQWNGRAEQK